MNIAGKSIICIAFFSRIYLPCMSQDAYKIYGVQEGREVSLAEIAQRLDYYDVLFFGEEHNDSIAHLLQFELLKQLTTVYKDQLALSLEMFDRDVQLVMDEYLEDHIRERNFTKDARVWNNYKDDYRPLVEWAKENKLDVICANAPSRYTNLSGRKGQKALKKLSKSAKTSFAPLPYKVASGAYYDKLMALTAHPVSASTDTTTQHKAPAMSMGGFDFIAAQSLWDATMAYSVASYYKKHKRKKVLQINGRFHSDERFAIVEQIAHYQKSIRSLIISAGPDESFPDIDWKTHEHLGDYIIITAPQENESE